MPTTTAKQKENTKLIRELQNIIKLQKPMKVFVQLLKKTFNSQT